LMAQSELQDRHISSISRVKGNKFNLPGVEWIVLFMSCRKKRLDPQKSGA